MDEDKLPRPAMIAITLLRVVIGWHFLYEGVSKLTSTTWSAAGFNRRHASSATCVNRSLVRTCCANVSADGLSPYSA